MSEWWTYGPRDLLLFSPQTYYRLFELHNLGWWPLPLAMLALGAALTALGARGGNAAGRVVALSLAACWLWVAWAFHWQRYAAINPAAVYFALVFTLEALLLGWGAARGRLTAAAPPLRRRLGTALLLFALLGLPLLGPLFGRSWSGAEVFGMAPDPTALATLGVLLRADTRRAWPYYPLPLAWCLLSGATLWAMDAPDFAVVPLAAVLAVASTRVGASNDSRRRSGA